MLGLEAIRVEAEELPTFLNEYNVEIRLVFGLCIIHAMRNAGKGSSNLFGYARARNFVRAGTLQERAQKLQVLRDHNTASEVAYLESREENKEIGWLKMHTEFGVQCTYGMYTSNASETSNNHIYRLRGSLITLGIEETYVDQSKQCALKLSLAHGYRAAGNRPNFSLFGSNYLI